MGFYLLYNSLCSIIIALHTVGISNVLSLTVDYSGCLLLASVLMLIHYVLDVSWFPQGVKSYVLLSLSHLCLYLRSLDKYFHCFAHIIPVSCSNFLGQFFCCMLGFGCVFPQPACALAGLQPCSLGCPSLLQARAWVRGEGFLWTHLPAIRSPEVQDRINTALYILKKKPKPKLSVLF